MEMNEVKEVAEFLFKKKIWVHINTFNDSFYNGWITELHSTHIILNDRVSGLTPIAFSQIKSIEKFYEKNAR